ncbi:nuclear transport factor 2 family protein [Halopenitus persicus]|uniref:Ketosteroid isomerase-related protein n=1 Tax=Halopenitus persicus TaxID=1048396 RepID=A0A1H3ERY9_9EURY|nr:nuclear transport factor 2 family protein [Halopenitus persicus]QHS17647.1 nuclear transport factor 2 family protein [haloarchaeon 3A1-DGR]SDX80699.1 Ketosteroid isomerase-related protein [Halopenitus persicus]
MGGHDARPDGTEPRNRARRYYEAIDAGDYATLRELLAPSFVHDRPDRTLEGRDRFVRFMREERPRTDTRHTIDGVYANGEDVAVRGRLLDDAGAELFAFVDVFEAVDDGTDEDVVFATLRTYTR